MNAPLPYSPEPSAPGAPSECLSAMASVPELVAELAAGRMIVLMDDEDRENEGDLVIAADHVTPHAINFMARHARGLVCLTLTRERCERLHLVPMAPRNGTQFGTAFTVSIEAAEGVTTGISPADRARTIQAAIAADAQPQDLVQPGHVFPIQAQDGGVLMRAGHTEAGCDLARMAGCTPAAVICEIIKDDGEMARLPDLLGFAAQHGLKIGTIASLIAHRSRHESLVQRLGTSTLHTAQGEFTAHVFRDHAGGTHLALTLGQWQPEEEVLVRVHEPLSALDWFGGDQLPAHSWPLPDALAALQREGRGAAVLLNAGAQSAGDVAAALLGQGSSAHSQRASDPRVYGIGSQILRELGVRRLRVLGSPRRLPSMAGYGLEITGFEEQPCKA